MKLLALGPASGPMTGQRRMFEMAIEGIQLERVVVSTGDDRCLINFARNMVKILHHRSSLGCVYFTPSRTLLGFYRDLIYLTPVLNKKTRIVGHIHGSDWLRFYSGLGRFNRVLFKIMYDRVNLIIVLVYEMEKEVKASGYVGPVVVIPNCVDYD